MTEIRELHTEQHIVLYRERTTRDGIKANTPWSLEAYRGELTDHSTPEDGSEERHCPLGPLHCLSDRHGVDLRKGTIHQN